MSGFSALVGSIAPVLGTALGGPLGGIAGKLLSEALGVENNEDAITNAINNDPEALAKIKVAQANLQARLAEAEVDLEAVHAGDRASARRREIEVGGIIVPALAVLILSAFFSSFYVIATFEFSTQNGPIAFSAYGTLAAMAAAVVTYYFGTSASSQKKTAMLGGKK